MTQMSIMKNGTSEPPGYRGELANGVNETTSEMRNIVSLQLQVSVTVLYTFCFVYSKLSVSLMSYVCAAASTSFF